MEIPPHGYCFTTAYKELSRVLKNEVEIESAINPAKRLKIIALWDTGAGISLIRPDVVKMLNLLPVSMTMISTPTSKAQHSCIYSVNLYLPNRVSINNIKVVEGIPSDCDMLIGMDVITLGDFAVSNYNGITMFSFRMPSMAGLDFCKHSYLASDKLDKK